MWFRSRLIDISLVSSTYQASKLLLLASSPGVFLFLYL